MSNNRDVSIKFIVNTAEAKKAVREFKSELASMKQQQALKEKGLRVTPGGDLKRIGSDKVLDPTKTARLEFKRSKVIEKKKEIAAQEESILKKRIEDQKMFNKNHAYAKKKEKQEEKEALRVKKRIAAQEKQILIEREQAEKKFATKSLQRNLSGMFFWMQVSRVQGQALRSMMNTYKTATQGNSALDKATTRLSASWEFLKFSIINSLDTSAVYMFIDGVQWLIEKTTSLIDEFDWLGPAIVTAMGVLFVGGAVAMGFHQFLLWYNTFFISSILASTQAATGTAAATSGMTGMFKTAMGAMRTMLGAGFLLYGLFKLADSLDNPSEITAKTAIMAALSTGLGVGLLTANPLAGFIAGVAVLVTMVIAKDIANQNEYWAEVHKLKDKSNLELTGYYDSYDEALAHGWQGTVVPGGGRPKSIDDILDEEADRELTQRIRQSWWDYLDEQLENNVTSLSDLQIGLNDNSAWQNFGGNVSKYGTKPLGELDDMLVTHSVVPNLDLLGETLQLNTTAALPMFGIAVNGVTVQTQLADDAIKALTESINNIPKETHIYIYKHIVTDRSSTD